MALDIKLRGQFKIDVFNSKDELVSTTDFFDNFITSTGLSYIYSTGFADTFKFLSIGSGTGQNTLYTTGLEYPYPEYSYLNNYVGGACGYNELTSGLRLFRGWRVPDVSYLTEPLDIEELMVSPDTSGTNSKYAFSRILKSFIIPSGDYSVISYRLGITVPTGIRHFANVIDASQVNQDPSTCRLWGKLSGRYSQVHHGLKLIVGEDMFVGGAEEEDGESFIPEPYGAPMEPSTTKDKLVCYLSTDGYQFLVNSFSGGKILTSQFKPYYNGVGAKPFGSGICTYHYDLFSQDNSAVEQSILNIRKDFVPIPNQDDFRQETNTEVFEHEAENITITPLSFVVTGRTRSLVREVSWNSVQNNFVDAEGLPQRLKSLVLAYNQGLNSYYPLVDMLFATQARELLPSINTGAYTYNTGSITGQYPYVDLFDNLTMTFKMIWSSDCPSDVSGCN
jgi:hypothetical protein